MIALQFLACLAGIVACVRFLAWLCKPVAYRQSGRFAGNETAIALYEHRREALGYSTARNVRIKESA